jgi:hypothetical protein
MLNPVSVAVSFLPGFTLHPFLHLTVKWLIYTDVYLTAVPL